jgi:phage baseplate assembly protein W
MAIFTGFSTIDVNTPASKIVGTGAFGELVTNKTLGKKFKLTDKDLVIRDLMNSLSIRQGEKPGNPAYGTNIWSYVFDPSTSDLHAEMEKEIRRVIALDPRINLHSCVVTPSENEVSIELEVEFNPFGEIDALSLNLSKSTGKVTQTS